MSLELYAVPLSPYTRAIELQLSMKRVDCTVITPTREFVREGALGEINPLRKIPVLKVDGQAVPEAHVICELIEELYPEPSLLPGDAMARAQARTLSRIADVYIAASSVQLLNNSLGAASEGIEAAALDHIARGYAGFDRWLADDVYAAGSARSIADCTIPVALFVLHEMLPAVGVPNIPRLEGRAAEYYSSIRHDEDVAQCLDQMNAALQQRLAATA